MWIMTSRQIHMTLNQLTGTLSSMVPKAVCQLLQWPMDELCDLRGGISTEDQRLDTLFEGCKGTFPMAIVLPSSRRVNRPS
jgi:hypothetical protein